MSERGERPLRLVVFSQSLIADVDNPGATSTRALLGALSAAGHDVTHLERRGNPLLDRQLRTRGSAALRSLNARYPDVRIRQYDVPPSRQNRGVWFGTEVSTADAVVALPGTPDEVLELIAPFETPHLVRLVPAGAIGDLTIEPLLCVERLPQADMTIDLIAVAYDNIDAMTTQALPETAERVVVGASNLPGWRYVPEVDVAALYRTARVAMVLDADERPEALARQLLALAAGCSVVTTSRLSSAQAVSGVTATDIDGLADALSDQRYATPDLTDRYDAAVTASALVGRVRDTLAEKRRAFAAALPGR